MRPFPCGLFSITKFSPPQKTSLSCVKFKPGLAFGSIGSLWTAVGPPKTPALLKFRYWVFMTRIYSTVLYMAMFPFISHMHRVELIVNTEKRPIQSVVQRPAKLFLLNFWQMSLEIARNWPNFPGQLCGERRVDDDVLDKLFFFSAFFGAQFLRPQTRVMVSFHIRWPTSRQEVRHYSCQKKFSWSGSRKRRCGKEGNDHSVKHVVFKGHESEKYPKFPHAKTRRRCPVMLECMEVSSVRSFPRNWPWLKEQDWHSLQR